MKPRSTKEAYWRTSGKEARKFWQQGPGAAKTARNFTLLQAHRAMRAHDKCDVQEGIQELIQDLDLAAGSTTDNEQ